MDFTQPWDFGDITFIIEEKKIYANKGVLSMSSAVFRAMFTSEFAEKRMTEIPLPDKTFGDFLQLVQVLHPTHPNSVNDTNVDQILPLAHEYQIQPVFENCTNNLLKQPPTLLKLNVAEKYNLSELHEKCLKHVKKLPLSDLTLEAGYKDMKPQTLTEIFKHKAEQFEELKQEIGTINNEYHYMVNRTLSICPGTFHAIGSDEKCPACIKNRYNSICEILKRY